MSERVKFIEGREWEQRMHSRCLNEGDQAARGGGLFGAFPCRLAQPVMDCTFCRQAFCVTIKRYIEVKLSG